MESASPKSVDQVRRQHNLDLVEPRAPPRSQVASAAGAGASVSADAESDLHQDEELPELGTFILSYALPLIIIFFFFLPFFL